MLVIIYWILWILQNENYINLSYNKAIVYKNKFQTIIYKIELIGDFVVNNKVIFTFVNILNNKYNFFKKNQKFIIWGIVVDYDSYIVTTYRISKLYDGKRRENKENKRNKKKTTNDS